MKARQINKILNDTAYVRTGGSAEELECAEYIRSLCADMGLEARLESFEVQMATVKSAKLTVDSQQIECKGYLNCGSGVVEAELYYLRADDKYSLSGCRGKIVLTDGYLGYWRYRDLVDNGAVGFITYDGNVNYSDRDIDQRELREYVADGVRMLGVNINAKDAVKLIHSAKKTARLEIEQEEYVGTSHNCILDMPGEKDEYIVLTAHYDSTSLSQGAYDNMSGSIGILGVAEYFSSHKHLYGLRFIWCGSEERGLLGSKAYCAAHENELQKTVLNVNLDMIGCIMGKFIACCTAEEALVSYIEYMGCEMGFQVKGRQGVYSSDSTPFADKGVPSLSFARIAPQNTATIHNSYDTKKLISAKQMIEDIDFITAFVCRMASSRYCPVSREIPEKMKTELDEYLCRKRKQ